MLRSYLAGNDLGHHDIIIGDTLQHSADNAFAYRDQQTLPNGLLREDDGDSGSSTGYQLQGE